MPVQSRLEEGVSLHKSGDAGRAADIYREVLEQTPDCAEAHHLLGLSYYQMGELPAAYDALKKCVQLDPQIANAWNVFGMVLIQLQLPEDALSAFRKALTLEPNHTDALNNISIALKKASKPKAALPFLEKLATLLPDSPRPYCITGQVMYRIGDLNEASKNYRKALRLDPRSSTARVGLGEALESMGEFDQARMQYLAILRRNGDHIVALSRLIQLKDRDVDARWIAAAESLASSSSVPIENRQRLHISLAYFFDRKGEFNKAFSHLQIGNKGKSERSVYDDSSSTREIDELIKSLTPEFFENTSTSSVVDYHPIFIVGMPRSGTTLAEQILASHSKTFGAGELTTTMRLAYQLKTVSRSGSSYPSGLTSVGRIGLTKLAREYIREAPGQSEPDLRIIDKMPFNYLYIGLLALMFPTARIVHCVRNPLDTCLSCYFTGFNEKLSFTKDLQCLGNYYLKYWKMMSHWRNALPGRIFDLEYESVICDSTRTISELLQFCDLEWEDQCLSFYETKRNVRTPSRWQVRQPLYKGSVNRWRNYEDQLEPIVKILEPILE